MELEIILGIIIGLIIGIVAVYVLMKSRNKTELVKMQAKYDVNLQQQIEDARKESNQQQRSTIKGKIGEQMAPMLPEFTEKYEPADARFIGTPIDYVIFKNMHTWNGGEKLPVEIILMDVKTGKSNTTPIQNAVKDAIQKQRVSFDILKPEID